MASKSAPPLPLPLSDYELTNEQITRRTIRNPSENHGKTTGKI